MTPGRLGTGLALAAAGLAALSASSASAAIDWVGRLRSCHGLEADRLLLFAPTALVAVAAIGIGLGGGPTAVGPARLTAWTMLLIAVAAAIVDLFARLRVDAYVRACWG